MWYVPICMYGACPQVYEYRWPIMVRAVIRFFTIVRVSKHKQGHPVDIKTIWMYLMKNQELVKTTKNI